MQLLFQVLGVMAGGLLVLVLARSYGLAGRRATGTVAVVAITVGALVGLPNLRDAVATFGEQEANAAAMSPEEKRLVAGASTEMNVAFLSWAEERIGSEETFAVVSGPSIHQQQAVLWTTFQLAPRLALPNPSEADWTLFYEVEPAAYSTPEFSDVQEFESGYAIARYAG